MAKSQSSNSSSPEKEPMKLPLVFLWGFVVSLAVVGGTIWLFAAYETANWWPWTAEPRLSQNEWFEIVRNAVTTAAALGVGVTLFFSYRRQQTAEKMQRLGVDAQVTASKAQEIAAKALKLSNKQHALDQDRRKDAVTSELRSRYAKSAEQLGADQLSVRLAGIYSLAALADDWAENGNEDERQVCIDLLGAYYKSLESDSTMDGKDECKAATLDVIATRIRPGTSAKKFWGGNRIRLENVGQLPLIKGVVLERRGSLTITGAKPSAVSMLVGIDLRGGELVFQGIKPAEGSIYFVRSALTDGNFRLRTEGGVGIRSSRDYKDTTLRFQGVKFDGAAVNLICGGMTLSFIDCDFNAGDLIIAGRLRAVEFKNCRFNADILKRRRDASLLATKAPVLAGTIRVENCTYAPGVPVVEERHRDEDAEAS